MGTTQPIPAFQAVDQKLKAVIHDSGTRAVGVAITHQGRLVYARGYTLQRLRSAFQALQS